MARYLIEHGAAGTADYWFKGWDEIGGAVTEATDAASLGETMVYGNSARFKRMAPGTRNEVGTTMRAGKEVSVYYFRAY